MELDFQPENLPPKPEKSEDAKVAPLGAQASPAATPVAMVSAQPKPHDLPPVTPLQESQNDDVHSMMPPARPKKSKLMLILGVLLLIIIIVIVVLLVFQARSKSTQSTLTNQTDLSFPPTASTPLTDTTNSTLPSASTSAGRDAQRKEDIRKISTLLAAYYADNQSYPISPSLDKLNELLSITAKALAPNYTAKLPVDPLEPDYFYAYKSVDGKSYELTARIEDSVDAEATLVGSKYLFILKK